MAPRIGVPFARPTLLNEYKNASPNVHFQGRAKQKSLIAVFIFLAGILCCFQRLEI